MKPWPRLLTTHEVTILSVSFPSNKQVIGLQTARSATAQIPAPPHPRRPAATARPSIPGLPNATVPRPAVPRFAALDLHTPLELGFGFAPS
jgi:hypothetical protein